MKTLFVVFALILAVLLSACSVFEQADDEETQCVERTITFNAQYFVESEKDSAQNVVRIVSGINDIELTEGSTFEVADDAELGYPRGFKTRSVLTFYSYGRFEIDMIDKRSATEESEGFFHKSLRSNWGTPWVTYDGNDFARENHPDVFNLYRVTAAEELVTVGWHPTERIEEDINIPLIICSVGRSPINPEAG